MISARSLQLSILTAVAVAAPAIARAETTAIVVGGDPGKKAAVVDSMAPWLEGKGQSVLLDSMPQDEVDKLVDCYIADDPKCAQPIVASSGVNRFVFVMVEIDRDGGVTLTGWLFSSDGLVRAQERAVCAACRVDNLTRIGGQLLEAMWRAADASMSSLKIATDPTGARITIDGKPAGVSPLEIEVAPGTHEIRVELDGHDPGATTVEAIGGKIVPVDFALQRSAIIKSKSRLPWFVIGGGGAALVISGVLFAIDEDDPPPAPGRPAEYTDTALPAAVIGGLGVAAVGVGVYLILRKPKPDESAPIARVSADGVVVGWGGRF